MGGARSTSGRREIRTHFKSENLKCRDLLGDLYVDG
jgi:hypothetical protein